MARLQPAPALLTPAHTGGSLLLSHGPHLGDEIPGSGAASADCPVLGGGTRAERDWAGRQREG